MGVIINDIQEATSSTDNIDIPIGQHDYMLVLFTCAYQESGSGPSRGAPSGGGGTWNAVTSHYVGIESSEFTIYAWYSYPTSRGDDVTINTGSSSSSGQYSVLYSLSNAVYYGHTSHGETSLEITEFLQSFSLQAGKLIGFAGVTESGLMIGPRPDTRTSIDEGYEWTGGNGATFLSYHRSHTGVYNNPHREEAGLDYNSVEACAHIQLAIDAVECSIV